MKIKFSETVQGWTASLSDMSATANGDTKSEALRELRNSICRRHIAEEEEKLASARRAEYWRIRRDAIMTDMADSI